MRKEYAFSMARRAAGIARVSGKTRITIRLDDDLVAWFKSQVNAAGRGNYQSLINTALRDHMNRQNESLETILRRVLREELRNGG